MGEVPGHDGKVGVSMQDRCNIHDETEMNETISIAECRDLRKVMNALTSAPMLTKREYIGFMIMADGVINRMEKEGAKDAESI